jgi:hypothetical protein
MCVMPPQQSAHTDLFASAAANILLVVADVTEVQQRVAVLASKRFVLLLHAHDPHLAHHTRTVGVVVVVIVSVCVCVCVCVCVFTPVIWVRHGYTHPQLSKKTLYNECRRSASKTSASKEARARPTTHHGCCAAEPCLAHLAQLVAVEVNA